MGFMDGLASGMAARDHWDSKKRDEDLRSGLADASNNTRIEQDTKLTQKNDSPNMVYDDQSGEMIPKGGYVPADDRATEPGRYDGLSDARKAEQLAANERGDVALTKPEFDSKTTYRVRGSEFADKAAAESALPGLRDAAITDVYRSKGLVDKARDYETGAVQLDSAKLSLKGARRTDELGEANQGTNMALAKHAFEILPAKLHTDMINGLVSREEAARKMAGAIGLVAEYNPERLNDMVSSGDIQKISPFMANVADVSREGNHLVFKNKDGGIAAKYTTKSLHEYSQGGPAPMKIRDVAPGAKVIGIDPRTSKSTTIAEGTPDPTKNDARQDDAVAVMTRLLDANKTMMTHFGGDEQSIRQDSVLEHAKDVGEFKRKMGRAPTLEEAAVLADGAFKRATARYKK
jgi:hypothetical protein